MLRNKQKEILNKSNIKLETLSNKNLQDIATKRIDRKALSDGELLEFLKIANALYRGGDEIISDNEYDNIYIPELKLRHPRHSFLRSVEPESAFEGKKVKLPERMLSTEKAYSESGIKKWIKRVKKYALDINLNADKLKIHLSPKLDGYAAYYDGKHLYTRGDGRQGTDVSRVFERGLKVMGDGKRAHGAGEIVVNAEYFREKLSKYYDNSRNFQAAILAEKKIEVIVQKAIDDKAALFFPFSQLPAWKGTVGELEKNFKNIVAKVWAYVDYDVDGVVIEITKKTLKEYMGATQHHHRWQIAYKENIEKAEVEVLGVIPQTSRTGRVNPVAELEPVRLSGATISRVSAHHYKMVKERGIGKGAVIELVRSGLVIPKIEKVVVSIKDPDTPKICPSCKHSLIWNKDYLCCPNTAKCPAQIEHTIEHFFSVLGNIDGFGEKTINKLFGNGVRSVSDIYSLTKGKLKDMDFGEKTSINLIDQLARSKMELVPDWRFLAAFGVFRMGKGNCEKLLKEHRLSEIFKLTQKEIIRVEGFSTKTAKAIVEGFGEIEDEFKKINYMKFNLDITPLTSELKDSGVISNISGKRIVFTGSMESGKRQELEAKARKLGAKVSGSVSKNTDYLVAGNNVGKTKIDSAKLKGVEVVSEEEYLMLIK